MTKTTEAMARELEGRTDRLTRALNQAASAAQSYEDAEDWVKKEADPETSYTKRIGQRLYFARIELSRAIEVYERLMTLCAEESMVGKIEEARVAGEAESQPLADDEVPL